MARRSPLDQPRTRTLTWSLLGLGIFPLYVNGYVNSHIAKWPTAYWSFELFYWVLIPTIVFMALVRYGGLRMSEIGLNGLIRGRRSVALIVFLSLILCPFAYVLYRSLVSYFPTVLPSTGLFEYSSMLPSPGTARTSIAIYFALTAGIVEELYFRGLMYKACSYSPYSIPLYLLASPVLFALIHWENGAAKTAAAYVFGVFYAILYVTIRNLWPLIVSHAYVDYEWFA